MAVQMEPEPVELSQLVDRLNTELLQTLDVNLQNLIEDQARSHGVYLTAGAYLMLMVPLLEASGNIEFEGDQIRSRPLDINAPQLQTTLESLMEALSEAPQETLVAREDARDGRLRTSFSVIRAYAERFCRIPPFCR